MVTIGAIQLYLLGAAQFIAHFDYAQLQKSTYSSDYDLLLEGKEFTLNLAVRFTPNLEQVEMLYCDLYPREEELPLLVAGSCQEAKERAIAVINDYLQNYAFYIASYAAEE